VLDSIGAQVIMSMETGNSIVVSGFIIEVYFAPAYPRCVSMNPKTLGNQIYDPCSGFADFLAQDPVGS
jgi:hypothetical protein